MTKSNTIETTIYYNDDSGVSLVLCIPLSQMPRRADTNIPLRTGKQVYR